MKELIYHRLFYPAMERYANDEAIVDGGYRATFAEHGERVTRLANAMGTELGVGRGDRVAIMALNSAAYLELYHACYLGAGIVNPLNLRLAGPELDYIVRDSGTEVAFVDAFFAEPFAKALEAAGDSPIRTVVLIGAGDGPHDVAYEDLVAAGSNETPPEPEEDDPVVLMYTGGTTGLPKGVVVQQRAEMLNAYHVAIGLGGLNHDEVFLSQTPLFHAASMASLLLIPATGAKLVTIPAFDPAGVMNLIEAEGITQTVMVPTMIGLCIQHPDYRPERLASLRSLVYGASPMPEAILNHLLEHLPEVNLHQGYGMTECSSVLTLLGPEDHVAGSDRLRSVGRPVFGVNLCIQDEDGNVQGPGEIGEVCARAGNFMREYWNKPEATAEVFEGGWYHSGDAGYLDEDGYLFLVDRVKDMIVSGGENVYSTEVESAISTHPGVAQVAVIGIPDPVWGEAVHAVVVPAPGHELTEAEVCDHARELIAGYKVPKSVEFRAEPLPLSGAMKVLKRDLRAPYWEGQDKKIG
ncbi:long-chain-fatty-acid--CoA ligase [Candidatus Poriferisocius sp.]|uniref:long-chain-fatty-acid--CoA ligase n=1 Tax=Candidatus Poriferisocius sp. TaxID=3101276 RepID=UPI003B59DEF9